MLLVFGLSMKRGMIERIFFTHRKG